MKSVDRILGEAVRRPTYRELTDPPRAYRYAKMVIKGRWPKGEATIAKDPEWAYKYAMFVIEDRWPEAEETIANSEYKLVYLEAFPEAKDDWALNGLIDWLDT